MAYIATKRLKIGHDEENDTPIYAEPGEVVDVSSWPWQAVHSYESNGHIKERPDAAPTPEERPPAAAHSGYRATQRPSHQQKGH